MLPFISIQDKQAFDWCMSSFFDEAKEIEDLVV